MLELVAQLPTKSYAPELHALRDFLAQSEVARLTLQGADDVAAVERGFDACYRMMGTAPRWRPSALPEIHDYASLSTGRAARVKDFVKRTTSRRPVFRSFLNEFVRDSMHFNDGVPSMLRDMGVPDAFFVTGEATERTHDLVYVGSVTASRGVDRLADWAVSKRLSLLLVGEPDAAISDRFGAQHGVTFVGPLNRAEIPIAARSARYAINYTPAIPPFDRQTSTKVLEYLALGLPVITNDYRWIADFERASGARMLRFSHFDQLDAKRIQSYDYRVPDMTPYRWTNIWDRSGVLDLLASLEERIR